MAKKQTRKQPKKVVLSKEAFRELFGDLKKFIEEELFKPHKLDLNHRLEMFQRQIRDVEKSARVSKRVLSCGPHVDRLEAICYSSWEPTNNNILALEYHCVKCGRITRVSSDWLSWREKRALRKLLRAGKI